MNVRKTHRYKYIPPVGVVYYYILDVILRAIVYEVILSAIALTILNITALSAIIARRYRLGSAF